MQSTRRISYAIARSFSTKPSSAEAAATTSKVSHEQLQSIKSMLRVDQAGELAADAIYKGQLATLPRNSPMRATIEHMHEQEKVHLEILNTLVANNRVRPSVFYPVWYAMGYALGAGTGAMGDKAAMMCTEVVEDVIGVHYNDQLRELVKIPDNEEAKNLAQVIKVLRDEELDHLSTAMDNHAKEATLYDPLSMIIRAGCKTAIQRMQPRLLATLVRSQPRALSMWTRSARAATPTLSLIPKAPVAQFAFRQYSAAPAPLSIEVVQERVLNVLKDFDKVDASKLGLDSHFITDLGLDSLDQVEITIAIEEEFNIELSDRDADDILTPRAAAEKVFANKHAM
ncbi:hypothetical protein HDU78_007231 [Chytriomyces hyalinus]|nr:hypothetical protein HDU78_007231 [Chytriomyces hyalinus]